MDPQTESRDWTAGHTADGLADSTQWHSTGTDEIVAHLRSERFHGLSEEEASLRLKRTGPNLIRQQETPSRAAIFINQFRSLVVWVLIGASVVTMALGEWTDSFAILGIIVLNGVLGFIQEYRAEQAAAGLSRLTAPRARVFRDGSPLVIAASHVVPGDVLMLDSGDLVSADARILEAFSLRVNEAPLTGESMPVDKQTGILPPSTPLAERSNMVFLGSSIQSGSAKATVIATGMQTELGRIAAMLAGTEREKTPLQQRIDLVARKLLYACGAIVAVIFGLGLLHSAAPLDLFMSAVSLAVAAIPEGLPTVITIALALGMQRMARQNALVRRLPAVETLGCAEVICTDKTGTLTVGEMTARRIAVFGEEFSVTGEGYDATGSFLVDGKTFALDEHSILQQLLTAGAACNDAALVTRDGQTVMVGDPTEGALLVAAAKAGLNRDTIEASMPRLHTSPFDSDRKMMTVVRRSSGGARAFTKGAPEAILLRCTQVQTGHGVEKLTPAARNEIATANDRMAEGALRVIALACRPLPDTWGDDADLERDLIFLGLVGLQDPPRAEARAAVARCRRAGIRTVMITGDHLETGRAVASELGILRENLEAIAGSELDQLDGQELERRVERIAVYARVTAHHKLRIVQAWKSRGAVVAMTGDGVNDAPALKGASIGVAMGITGTEVTKQAADIIIADDNFASIVSAVEEGRRIYDNVAKTLAYLLAGNAGEILVMFVAALVGWPVPLLPIQLLWINLVTDGLPAVALATDSADPAALTRPPRRPDADLMDGRFLRRVGFTGMLSATVTLIAFAWEYLAHSDVSQARSAAFAVLVIEELVRSFTARSEKRTAFEVGLLSNLRLLAIVVLSLLLQVALHNVPVLNAVFGTEPVSSQRFLAWLALGAIPATAIEVGKILRRWRKRSN